jgi:Fe-Mn family superoxide dismutase
MRKENTVHMTRRDAITALVATGASSLWLPSALGGAQQSQASGAPPPAGANDIKPLPFAPGKLKGISEKLIVSHHDNNYAGAVKNLTKVESELAALTKDSPAFLVAALKERELTFSNSMILHEHYFANLGGDGKPGGAIEKAIAERWGGFGAWEEEFRATGAGLAGGSGWVIFEFNLYTRRLGTRWSGNHTQNPAAGLPLLIMDMYEHAYQMDYGAAAAKYVDAFFTNILWEEVDRRYQRAMKMVAVPT